jgi:hypothetical protein
MAAVQEVEDAVGEDQRPGQAGGPLRRAARGFYLSFE